MLAWAEFAVGQLGEGYVGLVVGLLYAGRVGDGPTWSGILTVDQFWAVCQLGVLRGSSGPT